MRVPKFLALALFAFLLACLVGCAGFLEDYSLQPLGNSQTGAY